MKKISIEPAVINFFDLSRNNGYEVGGMLFGFYYELEDHFDIRSISYKKGQAYSISFQKKDTQVFYRPTSLATLGTWHYHPHNVDYMPSWIDQIQYSIWGSQFVHIIYNNKGYSVLDHKSKTILRSNFVG